MKNYILALALSLLTLCVSCGKDELDPGPSVTKRTVLIYAVASNNLRSYLEDDKSEMIDAASRVAGLGGDVRVLLYSVPSQGAQEAVLSELQKTGRDSWNFVTLRTYDRETYSTDPERMSRVFSDVSAISPSERYGLILWSHGTGWIPNFSDHQVPETRGLNKSFGLDTYEGKTDYCDIHELADAIPDGMFDYVWFDLCYMMGIEVAYQLRDKCDYIAGYPTEDWSQGMNYDSTLPMLAAPNPDLAGAADSFFNYYNSSNLAVTVTVAKTDGLEQLAQASAAIYAVGERPLVPDGLQNYSRLRSVGMYDFGQFTKAYLSGKEVNYGRLVADFDEALKNVLIYTGCSKKNFNGIEAFDPSVYSGFSSHFIGASIIANENYYNSLDWTKATRPL